MRRDERYAELLVVPITVADIVRSEMMDVLDNVKAPVERSGWDALDNLVTACDALVAWPVSNFSS